MENLADTALNSVTQPGKDLRVAPRTLRFYDDKGLVSATRVGNSQVNSTPDPARMILILPGKRLSLGPREIRECLPAVTGTHACSCPGAPDRKPAGEAVDPPFLRRSDGITMNRDRLLADAKECALMLAVGYGAPKPVEFRLPGAVSNLAFETAAQGFHPRGIATDYDITVAAEIAVVLLGGAAEITAILAQDPLLELERGRSCASSTRRARSGAAGTCSPLASC
jgi:DNA-binding transcriptional MerR regulator